MDPEQHDVHTMRLDKIIISDITLGMITVMDDACMETGTITLAHDKISQFILVYLLNIASRTTVRFLARYRYSIKNNSEIFGYIS